MCWKQKIKQANVKDLKEYEETPALMVNQLGHIPSKLEFLLNFFFILPEEVKINGKQLKEVKPVTRMSMVKNQ